MKKSMMVSSLNEGMSHEADSCKEQAITLPTNNYRVSTQYDKLAGTGWVNSLHKD
ncbi:hypothetical protein RIB2604_01503450 [Aspergillus luchuensis]|uniref:Uncharacterized protein n=1 Tax=Aspergillus kawachii TaxID=1069201 RepID=A0A146F986_ASPKA|nr:hypothetical protein RIB2604_01503450 [Aspergillus luchuensis]